MAVPLVYALDSEEVTLARGGGKAANLGRLVRARFPVPGGFVVGTEAYQRFVEANGLLPALSRLVARVDVARPETFATASEGIRVLFEEAAVPDEVAEAVREAYQRLGAEKPVAVRSSATAEDLPEASFAGQQDSYLNVQGSGAVLAAVRRCWSSLWTARAIAYRQRQGIGVDEVQLAVVVQEMVPADVAGVLFTVNPVTGREDELLINATWGLGEALVAGRVNPDTLLVDKASGRVKEVEIGDKLVMTGRLEQGTGDVEVEAGRRQQRTVSDEQARRLAEMGRAIEAEFGAPQDIEWAMSGDEIFILQARPVTTTGEAGRAPGDDQWPPAVADPQPFDLWTQADVGERWPEAVTPFTWSTFAPMIGENMSASFRAVGQEQLGKIAWARRAYGRVYMNEGAMVRLYNRFYGMPATMLEASLASPELVPEDEKKWRWGTVLRRTPLLAGMLIRWERDLTPYEKSFPQIERWVAEFMARPLTEPADEQLWQEAATLWQERLMHFMNQHAQVTSSSFNAFGQMSSFLEKAAGGTEMLHDLLSGLEGVISAEMVPALQEIAGLLREAGLAEMVLEQEPRRALETLRQTGAAQPALQKLDAFLARHGHRSEMEAEWLYPRWVEAPEQVLALLGSYLRAGEQLAPETDGAKRRQEAEQTVAERLDPLRRAYFRSSLKRLRRLARLRDNGQHYVVRLALPLRRLYATLGKRWAERGWLADADDFFFLVVPEIEQVLAAGSPQAAGLQLQEITAARRLAYDYWLGQSAPEVLDAAGEPVLAAVPEGDGHLRGVAASGGQVQGVVRVIHSPQEAGKLQPGDILVTRSTDPGWTPVFSLIGGLVLEVGGQLSHGAIVAREYGLPAVVNVPEATKRLQDGQQVRVDGTRGVVFIGEEEGSGGVGE